MVLEVIEESLCVVEIGLGTTQVNPFKMLAIVESYCPEYLGVQFITSALRWVLPVIESAWQ